MDRAHRLGQKQTVNVYRLLMRDSIEERVLGLQRFKIDVANAVINEVMPSTMVFYEVSTSNTVFSTVRC